VIKTLADALDVTLGDLLAEPTLLEWTSDSGTRTVPALRSALMNYRQLTPLLGVTTEGEPTPLDELSGSVAEVWDAYQDSRYGFATRRLPLLLADALIAAQAYEGRDREQVHELMAMTYQGAAMVLTKLGETDLAWIAADRGLAAAQLSGNATVTGSLFRSVAHCLLSNGRFDAAVQLVGDAGEYLRSGLDDATPEFLSIFGTLYLTGSMAAAHAEDRGTTLTFLGEADRAARRLGGDANYVWTAFGPTAKWPERSAPTTAWMRCWQRSSRRRAGHPSRYETTTSHANWSSPGFGTSGADRAASWQTWPTGCTSSELGTLGSMAANAHEAKMAHPRMAAGALFFDAADRILMVEPTYKDYWDISGGYVETGESPLHAAIREVREELGITPPIGRLLAVDWAPNEAEGDKVLYLFDGGRLSQDHLAQITLQPDELKGFSFLPPEQVAERTIPRLARRILAATEARNQTAPVYLEHGQKPEIRAA
jgi:ADP-ribose pyrophosphatase YjhB (NUDIX family)